MIKRSQSNWPKHSNFNILFCENKNASILEVNLTVGPATMINKPRFIGVNVAINHARVAGPKQILPRILFLLERRGRPADIFDNAGAIFYRLLNKEASTGGRFAHPQFIFPRFKSSPRACHVWQYTAARAMLQPPLRVPVQHPKLGEPAVHLHR